MSHRGWSVLAAALFATASGCGASADKKDFDALKAEVRALQQRAGGLEGRVDGIIDKKLKKLEESVADSEKRLLKKLGAEMKVVREELDTVIRPEYRKKIGEAKQMLGDLARYQRSLHDRMKAAEGRAGRGNQNIVASLESQQARIDLHLKTIKESIRKIRPK